MARGSARGQRPVNMRLSLALLLLLGGCVEEEEPVVPEPDPAEARLEVYRIPDLGVLSSAGLDEDGTFPSDLREVGFVPGSEFIRHARWHSGPGWESHPEWKVEEFSGLLLVRAPEEVQDRVAAFVRLWRFQRTGVDRPALEGSE